MYEAFYGLKDKPFSMLPDPGFLYLSKQHQTALTLLEYALVNQAGFCVVTGEPGAGKTTLLRKLLENVEDNTAVGMITNTHKSFGGMLDWILSAFNIHDPDMNKVQQNQRFTDFLLEQYASGKSCLLIVDEAQNMKAEALEELRMLSNVNSEKDQLLQIILAGQPELKQTLRDPELMQFAQRIGVDYHLDTLSAQETCHYIQHRLLTAGAQNDVFTPRACQRIYEYSGGTPRLINLICDTAMVYGFADQIKLIGEDIIDEMVRERMRDSVVPLFKDIDEKSAGSLMSASEEMEAGQDVDFPWINPPGGATQPEDDAESHSDDNKAAKAETHDEPVSDTDPVPEKPASDVVADSQSDADQTADKDSDDKPSRSQDTVKAAVEPVPARRASDKKPAADIPELTDAVVDASTPAADNTAAVGHDSGAVSPGDSGKRSNKWWFIGIALLLAVLLAVVLIAVNNNREIERMQIEAEKKLQLELERKEQAAAELAKKLEREKQEKLERERELKRQAELLQQQRDEALKKAQREAAERARQQKLAEKIRKQKEAEKKRLMLEAEKRRLEAELQLQREQAALQEKLRQQQLRLEQIEAEKQRREAEKAAAEALAKKLAAEKAAATAAAAKADNSGSSAAVESDKNRGFSSDPCSGPTAKFLSSCR